MTMFDTDFDAAGSMFLEAFGATATLQRGAQTSAEFTVEGTAEAYEIDQRGGGPRIKILGRSFVFRKTDVILGGEVITPREGDVLRLDDGNYQLMDAGPFRAVESLPGGTWWKVRTKEVA